MADVFGVGGGHGKSESTLPLVAHEKCKCVVYQGGAIVRPYFMDGEVRLVVYNNPFSYRFFLHIVLYIYCFENIYFVYKIWKNNFLKIFLSQLFIDGTVRHVQNDIFYDNMHFA